MLREDDRDYLTKNEPPLATPIRYLGVLVVPMRARGATVGANLPGRAMRGGHMETVAALGAFAQLRRRSLFAREGFKSYGAVPLIARGKLTGVLDVFHREQLQPDQEWLEFLDALGSEAAIAIDNADMYDQLQKNAPAASGPKSPAPNMTRLEKEILAT